MMTKNRYCVFVYATKADRKAGEMEFTVDTMTLSDAREVADIEIEEGKYCASIWERAEFAAPMQFIEAHIKPSAVSA